MKKAKPPEPTAPPVVVTPMTDPPPPIVRVGDCVAIKRHQGCDSGGIIVAVFDPIVVWQRPDGSHDVQDVTDVYIVARRGQPDRSDINVGDVITHVGDGSDAGFGGTVVSVAAGTIRARMPDGQEACYPAEECAVLARAVNATFAADQFADALSVDARGVPIRVGGRVLVMDGGITAIVVAVAANKVLIVIEADDQFGALYQDGRDVRVIAPTPVTAEYVTSLLAEK